MSNAPAPGANVIVLRVNGPWSGVRRLVPAKIRSVDAALAGAVAGDQFSGVVQLLSTSLPPVQVHSAACAAQAGITPSVADNRTSFAPRRTHCRRRIAASDSARPSPAPRAAPLREPEA